MSKKFRKLMALALCSVMLFTTACSSKDSGDASAPAASAPAASAPAASAPAASTPAPSEPASTEVPQPDGYPKGPITLIVPAKAGAAIDTNMRAMVDRIDLGADIVVQNVPGANQTIGIAQGATAKADGYTITVAQPAGNLIQPHLIDLTYSPDSFRYIGNPFGTTPMAIVVKADSPYQTMDDLIAAMKSEDLKYSTANAGSVSHIASLYMWEKLGVTATHVAFSGSAEVMTATLSGEVAFAIQDHGNVYELCKAGELRCLGIAWKDVPTIEMWGEDDVLWIDEAYNLPDLSTYGGNAFLAVPAGTPDDIYDWLCQEFGELFRSAEWDEYLKTIGRNGYEPDMGADADAACRKMFDNFGDIIDRLYTA